MKSNRREFLHANLLLACVCLLLSPLPALEAATFGDLYIVTVAPDPEAQDTRSDAIRRAMSLLLTRITGRQQASAYPAMQELIDDADRYRDSYSQISENEIRVGFIPSQIDQALDRLNMPIWGAERPSTLLWIASDFGDGQRVELRASDVVDPISAGNRISAGAVSGVASTVLPGEAAAFFEDIAAEMLSAADERGLPIVLPKLDAEDRRYVSFADVWGGFDRFVANAADRYNVDSILIARVSMNEFGLEVRWTAQRGDRRQTLTTPRARMGIDWLADEFASEFTTVGGARLTRITIKDIRGWRDFRVVEYLESVSIIESVDVESFAGGDLVLRVTARGDASQLDRVLTLDGELSPAENTDGLVYVPARLASTGSIDTL